MNKNLDCSLLILLKFKFSGSNRGPSSLRTNCQITVGRIRIGVGTVAKKDEDRLSIRVSSSSGIAYPW